MEKEKIGEMENIIKRRLCYGNYECPMMLAASSGDDVDFYGAWADPAEVFRA